MKKKLFGIFLALVIPVMGLTSNVSAAGAYSDTPLYQGMWSNDVKILQSDLRKLGYLSYAPTGYFGTHTTGSVITYQRANNLLADGVVGNATKKEITTDKLVLNSKRYIGVPYAWGGTSPSGFDCSGFTQYVNSSAGVYLPRTAELQYNTGYSVSKGRLKPGDLVFFTTYKPGPSHVGIYIGNNRFIAASSSRGVVITDLNNSYYLSRYIGARRVIS